jgi:hypothetical protein
MKQRDFVQKDTYSFASVANIEMLFASSQSSSHEINHSDISMTGLVFLLCQLRRKEGATQ